MLHRHYFLQHLQNISYCLPINKEECSACKDKENVIASMAKKLSSLSLENKVLKRKKLLRKGYF